MSPTKPVEFSGIGDNDGLTYIKVDFAKPVRLGPNFAVGFYQVDYQALANFLGGLSGIQPQLRSVVKIVMNEDSFEQLRSELNAFAQKVDKENSSDPTKEGK